MSVTLDNITYPECPPQPPPVSIGYAIFSQFVNGFLTSICVAVGTVGNFYSVRSVKLSNFDKNSNRGVTLAFSIVTLAIWDSILLWFAFFYYGFKNLVHAEYLSFVNIFTPYMHGCSQVANTASIWCVVAITVQRYWATRDPFRTTRWLLHITSAELKEYAPIRSSLRHHRALINSFRGDRRKSSSYYFCTMYRKQLAMPLALSFLAIFVNIPAFFEVTTITCYRILTKRVVYVLKISGMRLSPIYTLWYKVVFRMLITTCGPNICILLLTIRTVMLLRGSTKSRRHLFQMSDSLIDRYSSKATMLTMISIMLVVKFLAFRSLSFMLDIWELLFGFGENIRVFVYLVDLSNIMILLNSSTNCFIIFWCSKWLQEKIVQRNTLKREKLICGEGNWFASMDRINLLHKSWRQLVSHTHDQAGQRVLYAMLIGNPQVFSMFRQICKSSETGTPVQCNRNKRVVRLTSSARMISSPSMDWDPLGRLHPESISISATVNETIDDRYRHSPKPVQIVVPIMKQDDGEVFASAEDLINIPSTSSEGDNTVRFLLDAETVRQTTSTRPSSPASTTCSASSKSHNHHKKMKKSNSAVPVESQVKYYSCPMTDEERKEKPVEILMNRQFNKISEQITTFIGDTIQDMRKGTSEAEVSQSIRKLGDLHYEKGILIPPTAWRDFKQSIIKGLEECSYNNEHERRLVMETWNSFIAMFIREMKLSMLGASNNGTQPNVHHKFSTVSQCGNFERR